ncbi:hypothetical protein H5410_040787 [Solanum commersonii]|uniref:Uncharacterized protein n=1 Tax=Solanum commersonii TaxID=4109 RepID=A0A9J5XPY8_SOLCO|nr:hypothetical protein H5410_040787 [Solanum commersonii]
MTPTELNIDVVLKLSMRKVREDKGRKYVFGEMRYQLNAHAKAWLGIGYKFHEPVVDDIPTNEDKKRTSSEVDFDSNMEEIEPA